MFLFLLACAKHYFPKRVSFLLPVASFKFALGYPDGAINQHLSWQELQPH
jgi:hypothetical protein